MTVFVIMRNMIVQNERDDNIYGQEWEFQGELIEPEVEQQHSKSSSICIMKSVIRQLTFNSKMILLSMCGHTYETSSSICSVFSIYLFV